MDKIIVNYWKLSSEKNKPLAAEGGIDREEMLLAKTEKMKKAAFKGGLGHVGGALASLLPFYLVDVAWLWRGEAMIIQFVLFVEGNTPDGFIVSVYRCPHLLPL